MASVIRDKIVLAFFFALFLFVCYQIVLIFSPFIKTMFWAATIALITFPLHMLTVKYVTKSRNLAAMVTTLVIVSIALPVSVLVFSTMATQALELYDVARSYVSSGGVGDFLAWIRGFEMVRVIEAKIGSSEEIQQRLSNLILAGAKAIGSFTTAELAGLGKNLLLLLIHLVLCIFFLFFIFRDGPKFYGFIYDIVPMEEKHKKVVFQKVNDTFSAVLRGQFLTALFQGFLAGTIFFFLGLPLPFLLGFFTFLAGMIPIVGAGSIWVPVDIYLFATHQQSKALILLFLGIFAISLVDNFLKPILIGKKAKLPTLFLFLGLIGGLKLYGVLGLFLGPVLLSLFFALINIYQQDYKVFPPAKH